MSDRELVRVALSGDRDAVEELLLRHESALRGLARPEVSRLFDGRVDVNDVMQSFYVKICDRRFRALSLWNGLTEGSGESIEAYLSAILRNVIRDYGREIQISRRYVAEAHDVGPGGGEDPDTADETARGVEFADLAESQQDTVVSERERATLWRCIESALDNRQREVVRLSMSDQSSTEIGHQLSMQAGNVRVVLHRALAALKECVEHGVRNEVYPNAV